MATGFVHLIGTMDKSASYSFRLQFVIDLLFYLFSYIIIVC